MSADQETRLWLTMLRDYIAQQIRVTFNVRDLFNLGGTNVLAIYVRNNGNPGAPGTVSAIFKLVVS